MPYWYDDPTILLNKDSILYIWPTVTMTPQEKLNAMTRLILLLTLIGLFFTRNIFILLVGMITIAVLCFLFKNKGYSSEGKSNTKKEGFTSKGENGKGGNGEGENGKGENGGMNLDTYIKSDYEVGHKNNPFGNVLLTQIKDKPERKSAPPSFNVDVQNDITKSVKKMVQKLNPGIKNTNKQLFGDLGETFNLDQSNRNFFSTANTRIPNDQGAFANFLYGNMPSCKDGDPFACVQDNPRYNLY